MFEEKAIDRLSEIAARANSQAENIGARRLQTVMERLLEEVSFTAPEKSGTKVVVTTDFVEERFKDVFEKPDLAKYIL